MPSDEGLGFSFPSLGQAPAASPGLVRQPSPTASTSTPADVKPKEMATRLPLTAFMTVTHAKPKQAEATGAAALNNAPDSGDAGSNSRDNAAPVEKAASQVGYMRMMTSEGASSVCVPPRAVTREELRQHRAAGDAWIALSGKVYDISAYLGYHPGGARVLLSAAGKDGTALFKKHHAWIDADCILSSSKIGWLEEAS